MQCLGDELGGRFILHPLCAAPPVLPTISMLCRRRAEPSRYGSNVDWRVNLFSSSFAVPVSTFGTCQQLTLAAGAPDGTRAQLLRSSRG